MCDTFWNWVFFNSKFGTCIGYIKTLGLIFKGLGVGSFS
jgi:hypothetical protein